MAASAGVQCMKGMNLMQGFPLVTVVQPAAPDNKLFDEKFRSIPGLPCSFFDDLGISSCFGLVIPD